MSKVAIELDVKQIEFAIEQLAISDKLKIVQKLERETRKVRWNGLVSRIHQRFINNPIPETEITKICEEVRQKRYEKTLKSNYRH